MQVKVRNNTRKDKWTRFESFGGRNVKKSREKESLDQDRNDITNTLRGLSSMFFCSVALACSN